MKKLTLLLCTLFAMLASTSTLARTDLTRSPFKDVISDAVNNAEDDIDDLEASASASAYLSDGLLNYRVARVTYDTAVDGGGIGAHALGVTLPASSIIKQAFFYTVTQFADSGAGTVALSCEDAGNIYGAADITGNTAGTLVAGSAVGTVATMIKNIASACEVTATVAGATQTAGKLNLFLEYLVPDGI